jgi:hypothetical protein
MIARPTGRVIKSARILAGLTAGSWPRRRGLIRAPCRGRNYAAVVDALRRAGVEIESDGPRLIRKPRR